MWRVVWATNCYVRGAPNRESDKVAELPPGTTVIELGLQGDWVRHAKGWTLAKAGNNICMQVVGSADVRRPRSCRSNPVLPEAHFVRSAQSLGEGQATAATAAGTSASSSSSSSDSSAAATATGVVSQCPLSAALLCSFAVSLPQSIGDWDEYRTAAGQLFYYHRITKVTQWSKPESAAEVCFVPFVLSVMVLNPDFVCAGQAGVQS